MKLSHEASQLRLVHWETQKEQWRENDFSHRFDEVRTMHSFAKLFVSVLSRDINIYKGPQKKHETPLIKLSTHIVFIYYRMDVFGGMLSAPSSPAQIFCLHFHSSNSKLARMNEDQSRDKHSQLSMICEIPVTNLFIIVSLFLKLIYLWVHLILWFLLIVCWILIKNRFFFSYWKWIVKIMEYCMLYFIIKNILIPCCVLKALTVSI